MALDFTEAQKRRKPVFQGGMLGCTRPVRRYQLSETVIWCRNSWRPVGLAAWFQIHSGLS